MSSSYLQTTTSIAESERSDRGNEKTQSKSGSNGSGNGKPSTSSGKQGTSREESENGKESSNVNGKEEKIQNEIFGTMDLQTDENERRAEKKR